MQEKYHFYRYLFTLLFLKYLDKIYSKQLKLKKKMCLRNAYVLTGLSSLGVPILADLKQEGQIMPTTLLLAPPEFQTYLRPWMVTTTMEFRPRTEM